MKCNVSCFLAIGLAMTCAATTHAQSVMVDFGGADQVLATLADFQVHDSTLAGDVFYISEPNFAGTNGRNIPDVTSGNGLTVDIGVAIGNDGYGSGFTAGGGAFAGDPILGDYFFAADGNNLNLTISSVEEFSIGQALKLVVWGAGDVDDQDANVTVMQGAQTSGPFFHEADGSGQAYSIHSLVNDGSDILINVAQPVGGYTALGGFSLSAVPEPSSALLATIGFLAIGARRRR